MTVSLSRRRLAWLPVAAVGVAVSRSVAPGPAEAAAAAAWSVGGNALSAVGRLGATTSQALALVTAGVERLRVTAAGRVGIGTTKPAALLHVQSGDVPAGTFRQSSTNNLDAVSSYSATTAGGNAVSGYLTAGSPGAYAAAVYGSVSSTTDSAAIGMLGIHAGAGTGVWGSSYLSGTGVRGEATGGDDGNGHRGRAFDGLGQGGAEGGRFQALVGSSAVVGLATGFEPASGFGGVPTGGTGVYAEVDTPDKAFFGTAVMAFADGGSGSTGIEASASGASSVGISAYGDHQAGYFNGDVQVTGSLSKAGGSFQIDHPLDPGGKYLLHSFVESPDMLNIYSGRVRCGADGTATVDLPEWFPALNRDVRYQLTCHGEFAPVHIGREVMGGSFLIAGGRPGLTVSWQVTGVRQDAWANAHRIPVEVQKVGAERGRYLHPEELGRPSEQGLDEPARERRRQSRARHAADRVADGPPHKQAPPTR